MSSCNASKYLSNQRVAPNAALRLLQRELGQHPSGAGVHATRSFSECIVPTHKVLQTESPSYHIGKFTTDGKWLVCFSLQLESVVLLEYLGPAPAPQQAAAAAAAQPSQQQAVRFQSFFKERWRLPLCSDPEQLCRDFCLTLQNGQFLLLASCTPQQTRPGTAAAAAAGAAAGGAAGRAQAQTGRQQQRQQQQVAPDAAAADEGGDVLAQGQGLPSSDCCDVTTFHVVDMRRCVKVDQRQFVNDHFDLSGNACSSLHDNILALTSIRQQTIHLLQVNRDGTLTDVQQVGHQCQPDDSVPIELAAAAEHQWQLQKQQQQQQQQYWMRQQARALLPPKHCPPSTACHCTSGRIEPAVQQQQQQGAPSPAAAGAVQVTGRNAPFIQQQQQQQQQRGMPRPAAAGAVRVTGHVRTRGEDDAGGSSSSNSDADADGAADESDSDSMDTERHRRLRRRVEAQPAAAAPAAANAPTAGGGGGVDGQAAGLQQQGALAVQHQPPQQQQQQLPGNRSRAAAAAAAAAVGDGGAAAATAATTAGLLDPGGQLITGLRQRLLAFLYKAITLQRPCDVAPSQRDFQHNFGVLSKLVVWRARLLGRHQLLLKLGAPTSGSAAAADANPNRVHFFGVYDLRSTRFTGFWKGSSPVLLSAVFEQPCRLLAGSRDLSPVERCSAAALYPAGFPIGLDHHPQQQQQQQQPAVGSSGQGAVASAGAAGSSNSRMLGPPLPVHASSTSTAAAAAAATASLLQSPAAAAAAATAAAGAIGGRGSQHDGGGRVGMSRRHRGAAGSSGKPGDSSSSSSSSNKEARERMKFLRQVVLMVLPGLQNLTPSPYLDPHLFRYSKHLSPIIGLRNSPAHHIRFQLARQYLCFHPSAQQQQVDAETGIVTATQPPAAAAAGAAAAATGAASGGAAGSADQHQQQQEQQAGDMLQLDVLLPPTVYHGGEEVARRQLHLFHPSDPFVLVVVQTPGHPAQLNLYCRM